MEIALITISDRASTGEREDLTGPGLRDYINARYNYKVHYEVISDDFKIIKKTLKRLSDNTNINIILTCGGTGFSSRDNTPEATKAIIEKEAPGIPELMRIENAKNHQNSFLSRGICGIRKRSVIINLPGSPNGALENFKIIEKIIIHGVSLLNRDIKNCDDI